MTSEAQTHAVLEKIVLADLLDDAILGARPGEKTFPLRVFFGELGARVEQAAAFVLASGLNFFFRATMEDEDKMRIGFEVSRLFYAFCRDAELDDRTVGETAPLLATLLSSELGRVLFESVDHVTTFDSRYHERAEGSDPHGSRIVRPASFVAKVTANGMVRLKARVVT